MRALRESQSYLVKVYFVFALVESARNWSLFRKLNNLLSFDRGPGGILLSVETQMPSVADL